MSAPSDAERAREITRGWFRADNSERVMGDLHDRIAAALSAARAEGREIGRHDAYIWIMDNIGKPEAERFDGVEYE